MDMENACFYTFSTISQTLAGAFGFLVAVVLYQLQVITGRLQGNLPASIHHTETNPDDDEFYALTAENDWIGIARYIKQSGIRQMDYREQLDADATIRKFTDDAHKLKEIKNGLKWSLGITAVGIGLSLLLLMLTPAINRVDGLAWVLLAGDVALAWCCLGMYVRLAINATK